MAHMPSGDGTAWQAGRPRSRHVLQPIVFELTPLLVADLERHLVALNLSPPVGQVNPVARLRNVPPYPVLSPRPIQPPRQLPLMTRGIASTLSIRNPTDRLAVCLVVDHERKAACQSPVVPVCDLVDAAVEGERVDVREDAVTEVVAEALPLFFVEPIALSDIKLCIAGDVDDLCPRF